MFILWKERHPADWYRSKGDYVTMTAVCEMVQNRVQRRPFERTLRNLLVESCLFCLN
jgi:hypothetical protein